MPRTIFESFRSHKNSIIMDFALRLRTHRLCHESWQEMVKNSQRTRKSKNLTYGQKQISLNS